MMSKIGGVVGGGVWKYAHGTAHYGRNFHLKWLKVGFLFRIWLIYLGYLLLPLVLVNPLIITRSLSIYGLVVIAHPSTQNAPEIHCMYACSRDVWHQGRNPRALEHTLEDPSFIDWEVWLLDPLDSCLDALRTLAIPQGHLLSQQLRNSGRDYH